MARGGKTAVRVTRTRLHAPPRARISDVAFCDWSYIVSDDSGRGMGAARVSASVSTRASTPTPTTRPPTARSAAATASRAASATVRIPASIRISTVADWCRVVQL